MTTDNLPKIKIDDRVVDVESLSEYSFTACLDLPESSRSTGTLYLNEHAIAVEFRVRENVDGLTSCSFSNMPLADMERLTGFLKQQERGFVQSDLEQRSYDELAKGLVGGEGAEGGATQSNSVASGARKAAGGGMKSLVMLLMLFGLIGLVALGAYFLKSRSSLAVGNSALVGNYLPINVKVDGEIVELLVDEGDYVEAGEVLLRLKNPIMEMERRHCEAQYQTAVSKVVALKKQLKSFDKRLDVASKKLALDLEVAKSEAKSAEKFMLASKGNLERLTTAFSRKAITQVEYDIAQNEFLSADAAWLSAKNVIKQIEFSRESADDNILILGGRVDDEVDRLVAELEIAQAEQEEMRLAVEVAENQFEGLDVRAPRSGRVYVTYRQVGEFVKVADETIGLSFDGKVWAAGQVSSGQARRVRPGQPVTVSAPSMNQRFDGVVVAVGHRSMYSHGRYTADFRGETATDVPVKVMIEDLPADVPSGIRLEMAINTGFGVDWLDDSLGYKLKPISKPVDSLESEKPKTIVSQTTRELVTTGVVVVE